MQRRKRNIVIGILFCTLVFMGVGYAFLTKVIDITSLGIISSKWKIVITNVTVEEKYGYTSDEKMEYEGNNAELNATFRAPGDWIEFKIRVENQGTIDAVIEEVVVDQTNKEYIAVEVKGIEANERLNAEAYKEFIVRLSVKSTLTSLPNQDGTYETGVTIGLNYKQAGASTGSDSGSESTVCYLKDVDGSILYNYACGTEVVVPATTEDGTPITSISAQMFARKNVAIFSGYSDTMGQEITGGIIYDDENFDTIKSVLEMAEANGQLPVALPTLYRVSELEGLELSTDTKIELVGYLDLETFELSDPQRQITKLDLSQATNLTTIEEDAFKNGGIESIIFGDNSNLTTIGNYAFSKNKLRGELIIPASVTTIGNSAFEGSASTNQISKLTFEEGSQLTTIGNYAFYNNFINRELILPEGLNSLGFSSFADNLIEELHLPSTLTKIEGGAFSNNQISGELVIPASVQRIGNSVFGSSKGSTNKISKLTFAEGSQLTTIGEYAFSETEISGELIIPSSVVTIDNGCFRESRINKLTFAEGAKLQRIGELAFAHTRLSGELIIPASVITIGDGAFYGNGGDNPTNQISKLTFEEGSKLISIETNVFSGNNLTGELIIPASVTAIGLDAFSSGYFQDDGDNPISVLTFEEGSKISVISDYAFHYNSTLTTINTNMTANQWSGVSKGTEWHGSATPTINYKEG